MRIIKRFCHWQNLSYLESKIYSGAYWCILANGQEFPTVPTKTKYHDLKCNTSGLHGDYPVYRQKLPLEGIRTMPFRSHLNTIPYVLFGGTQTAVGKIDKVIHIWTIMVHITTAIYLLAAVLTDLTRRSHRLWLNMCKSMLVEKNGGNWCH